MSADIPSVRETGATERARFEAEIVPAGEPVALRGQVSGWPLCALAGDSDEAFCTYLTARANDRPAQLWAGPSGMRGRYGWSAGLSGENFERKMAPLATICELLLRSTREADAPAMFAGAVNLDEHAPDLLPDLAIPLLDSARHRLTSLWIGNPGRTAAHWDLPDNLSCVVRGERHYLLFPPEQVGNLYVGPIDRTLAGQPTSMVDCENPDFERFPRYREALAHAREAVLQPGDALFIPSMWFHQVISTAPLGAQVNFWWRENDAETLSPQSTLLHAFLTLRDLPERERKAWRAFFDHYVFGDPEQAAAHIPEAARSILGPIGSQEQLKLAEQLVSELVGWHNRLLGSRKDG
ncbi:cupin-like domain-containing protein [Novosphingobium sp. ZN18A2]|uniref:cupin-like domain-containing protein n=1 Tax=Novosphingobium sp. ZN18A2 TaxID=3079861 RepID=UPI0030CF6766